VLPGGRPPSTYIRARRPVRHYCCHVADPGETSCERPGQPDVAVDATPSALNAGQPLDELLSQVRAAMRADTVTILILDTDACQLVPIATEGLEEQGYWAIRIRVGQGFAGRVAQDRAPVVLARVTPANVVNPILLDKGVRSLLGVPISVAGQLVGVLHVGSLTPRIFAAPDIGLLQVAAAQVGLAALLRMRDTAVEAMEALRRLRPKPPPRVTGVTMAARYLPSDRFGVGGDWYDVFLLPAGWLGIVIGDVAGHGLASAVPMGQVRSALRAHSLSSNDPAEVLALLDRDIRHFNCDSFTTAVYATISPDRSQARLASAGHLRPILAVPGQSATQLPMAVDLPLGSRAPRRARSTTLIDLPPGALLLLYTDGLIERRDRAIDKGIAALAGHVHAGDPETVCTDVMSGVGPEQPADDVTVLAVHRWP